MSDFEEYYKSSEWFGTYESDLMMREAYIAGAQSQQSKIDLLEKELTETQDFLNKQNHIKQAKIDELQARIDEALNTLCKLQYSSGERIYNDVGNILKGNKEHIHRFEEITVNGDDARKYICIYCGLKKSESFE